MKKTKTNISTRAELASKLKVSQPTLSRYLNDSRWTFARKAPWKLTDVPSMIRFRADVLRDVGQHLPAGSNDESRDLRKAKLAAEVRKLEAAANLLESELRVQSGKYVLCSEVFRFVGEAVKVARDKYLNFGARISPLLVGKDTAEIDAVITEEISRILDELANTNVPFVPSGTK
jgi:hypothetical protein